VLAKIRYGGAMAECGGGFKVVRHHVTVANWIFRGGRFPEKAEKHNIMCCEREGTACATVAKTQRL